MAFIACSCGTNFITQKQPWTCPSCGRVVRVPKK